MEKVEGSLNIATFISNIRNNFNDDNNLYFYFSLFGENTSNNLNSSTFGSDNIKYLNNWLLLTQAKLHSGKIEGISIIMRRFLKGEKNKIEIVRKDGVKIKIPKKEIYHFLFSAKELVLFDKEDTFINQNTDNVTNKILKEEEGLIYMSSIDLCNEIFNKEFDLNNILEKVNLIGKNNLTKNEMEFLDSFSKNNRK